MSSFIGGQIPASISTHDSWTTIDGSNYLNCLPSGVYHKGTWISSDELDALVKRKHSIEPNKPVSKERVVFDKDYTIYYDKAGNKTVVHKALDQPYDAEKAVLYALLKSKGIEPKKVGQLMESSIDKDEKRQARNKRKLTKQRKTTEDKPTKLSFDMTEEGLELIVKEVISKLIKK